MPQNLEVMRIIWKSFFVKFEMGFGGVFGWKGLFWGGRSKLPQIQKNFIGQKGKSNLVEA